MSNTYKPFACSEPNCGQSFASEDRLNAHVVLHQTTTLRLIALPTSIVDQTPTPTRFLRNCDEIGLFQDINPFDKDFKKAVELQQQSSSTTDADVTEDSDARHVTVSPGIPCFILQESNDTDLEVLTSSSATNYIDSPVTHLQSSSIDDVTTFRDVTPCDDVTVGCTVSDTLTTNTNAPTALTLGLSSSALAVCQPDPSSADSVLVSYPVSPPIPSPVTVLPIPPASSNSVLVQVLVKLPTGQTVPVQVPADFLAPAVTLPTDIASLSPVTSAVAQITAPLGDTHSTSVLRDFASVAAVARQQTALPPVVGTVMTSRIPCSLPSTLSASDSLSLHSTAASGLTTLGIAASTRQKLKATVQTMKQQQQQQQPLSSKVKVDNAQRRTVEHLDSGQVVAAKVARLSVPVAMATTDHMTTVVDNVLETPRIQFEAADTSTHYHSAYFGGHSKSSSDDDSVDRRKRYLESNRAAANRCRQKKKEWVSNLETKANELEKINHKLEKEMRALKQEIHQLKLLLLEHKDCPAMMSNNLYIALIPQTQTIT